MSILGLKQPCSDAPPGRLRASMYVTTTLLSVNKGTTNVALWMRCTARSPFCTLTAFKRGVLGVGTWLFNAALIDCCSVGEHIPQVRDAGRYTTQCMRHDAHLMPPATHVDRASQLHACRCRPAFDPVKEPLPDLQAFARQTAGAQETLRESVDVSRSPRASVTLEQRLNEPGFLEVTPLLQ
jgi:hypothetical protein